MSKVSCERCFHCYGTGLDSFTHADCTYCEKRGYMLPDRPCLCNFCIHWPEGHPKPMVEVEVEE